MNNNPSVIIHYNPQQAVRCIQAAISWVEERKDKQDKKDVAYTFSVLTSLLQEAKAAIMSEVKS